MRTIAIAILVLSGLGVGVGGTAQAQSSNSCKQCSDQRKACKSNYAGKTCKSEYDICMKHCRSK
jgi:hypothetical protein